MQEAGKTVRMGFRGELLRERSNGAWVKCWINLTLDTLYLFKDAAFTDLIAQFSIRGVEGLTFPNENVDFCFELVSTNPPMSLKLAAVNDKDFEDWLFEFDWRIRAIQRVYTDSLEVSDSESDDVKDVGKAASIRATKRAQRTKKKIDLKQLEERSKPPTSPTGSGLNMRISSRQKELIREAWQKLLETDVSAQVGGVERAITRFFEEFYKNFFEKNPSGKRLFESESMAVQGRALVKMLAMIVKSLDDPADLMHTISILGGRHEIYGVEPSDYIAFANAMGDTLEQVLGSTLCTTEMKDAWFKVLTELSTLMQDAGKKLKHSNVSGFLIRKIRKASEWKRSAVSLSLDTLYIYKDDKMNKLRSSYPLSEVNAIEIMNTDGDVELASKYGFVIELSNYRQPYLFFCAETQEDLVKWIEELNWRVQAVARVYKEEAGDDSESTSVGDTVDVRKVKKAVKGLKKKKQQHKDSSFSKS
eukprot:TRINITY_DN335_c0_g1_i5.p1 TRINITY_DN335_c0_g1~~TRINITY_DN335_c0_g1_i5.p1  ORF type:complete len:475 (-),score=89.59 TRINITY_DN335_c0_g1_i5:2418-3842(-)